MVIKKSVLLSVLALGMLMQAPASATSFKVKVGTARFAVSNWFFNKKSELKHTYHGYAKARGNACHQQSYDSWTFGSQLEEHSQGADCLTEDVTRSFTNQKSSQKIVGMFYSPANLAQDAVICALLARAIQGKASAADYSKVAAYSFAGAMATSLLHLETSKGLAKPGYANCNETHTTLAILTLVTEYLILAAGQNPEAVKSIVASFKAKTAGKDLTALILSLNKDVNRRQRLAALVRTFGPFFLEKAAHTLSELTYTAYNQVKTTET